MQNKPSLDWNHLKYFLAVARHGGLTPAAQHLGSSPSTVMRHVDAMEAELGITLFLRQQQGYRLTDQGESLLSHMLEAEQAMLALERHGSQLAQRDQAMGTIRLATAETLGSTLVAPNLHRFFQQYPLVQVELIIGRQLSDLSRREADLALRSMNPEHWDWYQDYVLQEVGLLSYRLYGTPERCEQARREGWQRTPLIGWDEAWLKDARGHWLTRFPTESTVFRCNSLQGQFAAACNGIGLVLLPDFLGKQDARLQAVEEGEIYQRQLMLVWHRDLRASQRVLAMRDFLVKLLREYIPQA
ncbi:LysR family transcriptional regulator [Leeia sp.]|uniref:LysR family transcriptional regulator n=1 Tax=Leeia sp. TaxID=2884678 RepID=UPI0035AD9398